MTRLIVEIKARCDDQDRGRGKRGGARVVHFFHDASLPLFALTMFAKNECVDLSAAERNEFRSLTKIVVETYGKART
jgi:hypothetical protein